MTESGIIQLATLIVGAIVTIMLAFVQRDQRIARKERQELKDTLVLTEERKSNKIDTIHSLVNSSLGKEIKEKMEAYKELALKDPLKWQEKALEATKQYNEHERRQALVDANLAAAIVKEKA